MSIKLKFLISSSLLIFLSSCSPENGNNIARVTFPLLEERKTEVIDVLNDFQSRGVSEFEYMIENFSIPIHFQPNNKSFVTLQSKNMSDEDLMMMANNPILFCYLTAPYQEDLAVKGFENEFTEQHVYKGV